MKNRKPPGQKPRPDRTTVRTMRVPVLLTPTEYDALAALAEAQQVSMASILRADSRAAGHLPAEGSEPHE